jgi:DNA repair exonuclease SbcCD nuclease subunit
MKFAILNDTHCGIRNSSDIFLDNAEKFYADVFFPYLLENSISHIVHLGDIFDNRKFINFRALQRHRKMFLNKLREYKITMDIIPGNHDTYYKNTNDLNSLKELLGHFTDCINIIMEPTVMNYDGLDFALLPWIAQDNEAKSLDFIKNTKALYLGGHLDITGFEMMKGTVNAHGMSADLFDRFDGVYSGHFHTKSSKNNIHYLGSQMEFFWNDAHDPKYFHVFDTNAKQITQVLNPNTLHHRINYDDTRQDYLQYDLSQVENKFVKIVVINKNDLFTFDRFVDRIQARKIHELKIADNFNEFIGSSVNDDEVELEDTTTLLNTYVDAVDTDLDKDRIKVQMYELMIEAQTMEVV